MFGKKVIIMRTTTSGIINPNVYLNDLLKATPVALHVTKSEGAIGGVINPITKLKTANTPICI